MATLAFMSPRRDNHRTFSDQVMNGVVAVSVGIGVAAFREEPRDTSVAVVCAVIVVLGTAWRIFKQRVKHHPDPPE